MQLRRSGLANGGGCSCTARVRSSAGSGSASAPLTHYAITMARFRGDCRRGRSSWVDTREGEWRTDIPSTCSLGTDVSEAYAAAKCGRKANPHSFPLQLRSDLGDRLRRARELDVQLRRSATRSPQMTQRLRAGLRTPNRRSMAHAALSPVPTVSDFDARRRPCELRAVAHARASATTCFPR